MNRILNAVTNGSLSMRYANVVLESAIVSCGGGAMCIPPPPTKKSLEEV